MIEASRVPRYTRAGLNALAAASYPVLHRAPAVPLMVYVEVTRGCNLQCRHCDLWMTHRQEPGARRREVPAARLVETLAPLAPRGLLAVDLFGGEPLLRKDLTTIVHGLKQASLHVTLTTNATLLTRERADDLVRAGLDQLLVSLDGPEADIHDSIRGREGAFAEALEGLRVFQEAAADRVRVGINTLVCRENIAALPRMVGLASVLGAQQLRLLPYHQCYPFNQYTQDDSLLPRSEDLIDLGHALDEVKVRARELGVATNGSTYIDGIKRWYGGKRLEVGCMAGLAVCDINAFGDVFSCYTLGRPVGNIKDQPFEEIWHSKAMDSAREHTLRCDQCWQSCYVEPGMRLSLRALLADRRAVLHDIFEYVVRGG